MLELSKLTKRFGDFVAVREISFAVPDGAFLVLVGPSGCGKTTLLRMLAGLDLPTSGQISFGGKVVSDGDRQWAADPIGRNSGLVFQSYALWPHMSVRGNIEWPLKVAGWNATERHARADEVLQLLGISELSERYPNEISGGQQQRVAIARTIAPKPSVLLFDEPLSNLDAKLRVEMRTELMRLHRATGATTVYVTHDQIEAMTMASHVAVMRDGEVEQFGTPNELLRAPQTAFVSTFIGTPANNLLEVKPENGHGSVAGQRVSLSPPDPRQRCRAMIRPEAIALSNDSVPDSLSLEIVEVSAIAGQVMVTGVEGPMRVTCVVGTDPGLVIGDRAYFRLPPRPDCWFGEDGRRIA